SFPTRRSSDLIQAPAGVSVETNDSTISFFSFEIGSVQFQSVPGLYPHIFMRLFHHPFSSLMHEREILFPVDTGHLHGAFHFRVVTFHGSSVEISSAASLGCRCSAKKYGSSFQKFIHLFSPAFCCQSDF